MSIEKVNEVPFTLKRRQRGKLGQYWATMGFIFQLIRDIDPKLKYLIDTFTLIGLIWSAKTFMSFFGSLIKGFHVFIWSRIWKLNLKKMYGNWVVITGATDGIGLEYAKEFADRGHSLILIGRNPTKLAAVKRELVSKLSADNVVNIVTITADFNNESPELYSAIKEKLKPFEKSIGILVNNAGVMLESPNRYLDQSEDVIWQHVRVNIAGVLMMTRAVLPGMLSRRRGLIINMSSIAGYQPLPLMGVYSASKKFVEYFSKTLEYEYTRSHNIHVQTVIPSYISTKMTKWSKILQCPNFTTPNAATFVKSAIATIGRTNYTTGFWSHGLQYFIYDNFCPSWAYSLSSWYLLRALDTSQQNLKAN